MTDVSEWARREAARVVPIFSPEADTAVMVADRLAALLLSDKAVEAAAFQLSLGGVDDYKRFEARAALQAALTAITTNPETPMDGNTDE